MGKILVSPEMHTENMPFRITFPNCRIIDLPSFMNSNCIFLKKNAVRIHVKK